MRIFTALVLLLPASLETGFSHPASGISPLVGSHYYQTSTRKLAPQTLPKPTGDYRVGTAIFHLTDTSRPDSIAKSPGQFRELMFQVWYPTDLATKGKTAPYVPNAALLQQLKDEQHDQQSPGVFDGWRYIHTKASLDAPVSKRRRKFPLLFLSHGLGEPRSLYTALSQDLVSHGYVVVCIDHPYGGLTVLPDGRVLSTATDPEAGKADDTPRLVEAWAKDVSFVLGQMSSPAKSDLVTVGRFAKYIDLDRVGMLGHSLGGAAALEACRTDSRFRACADLDGVPFGKVTEEGVKRPTMILRSGPIYSDEDLAKRGRTRAQWEEMGRQAQSMWSSFSQKNKNVPVYSVKINGAAHMNYSDAPFVMPETINRFGGRIIDAQRGFQIMTAYIHEFFDKYLNGKRSDLLDGRKSRYPEVSAESFSP